MAGALHDRAGPAGPVSTEAPGIDVFISHVEEDGLIALALADALEEAGFSTWCNERDTVPGPSYLLQSSRAIELARAVVILISADALGSHQVTSEVVRAHEEVKPFIPLLVGISREEFGARQPEWREAIGSAATLELPASGISGVVPRIIDGLSALGVAPHEGGATKPRLSFSDVSPRPPTTTSAGKRRRWLIAIAASVAIAAVLTLLVVLLIRNGSGGPAANPPSPTESATSNPPGTAVKDAATTPLRTSGGLARVTARIDTQFCPIGGGACQTAPSGRVFLFLDLAAWKSGTLTLDQSVSTSAFNAHIVFQNTAYTATETHSSEGAAAAITVVFPGVPSSIAGTAVELRWPDNPVLRVHVGG